MAAAEYDEKLLPLLDDYLKLNQQPKQYYTIHLEGTHENFWRRYPKSFAKFTAEDEPGESDEQKKMQSEYDNAVYYNDYVVDEIIRRFEDKNAIVFYISDHGMDLYDTGDFAGHSSEEKGSYHMIEVPFIVWASPRRAGFLRAPTKSRSKILTSGQESRVLCIVRTVRIILCTRFLMPSVLLHPLMR